MALTRQSRPDSGLGLQVQYLKLFKFFPLLSEADRALAWSGRFRGGLVFKAHRLVYHSTLGLRVIKKSRRTDVEGLLTYLSDAILTVHFGK